MPEEIMITGVDKNGIVKDDSFPSAYEYPFFLSAEPDDEWQIIFHEEYHGALYPMKREMEIIENRIVLIIAETDNKEKHLDFLKNMVDNTNKLYQLAKNRQKEHLVTEQKRQQEINETKKNLEDESDKLKFN